MSNWPLPSSGARTETNGATLASSRGTPITAAGPSKGSWVEIAASISFDYSAVIINSCSEAVGSNKLYLIDVGVGVSGNERVVIEDLFLDASKVQGHMGKNFVLPIGIASGARIAIRVQCAGGGFVTNHIVIGLAGGFLFQPGFSRLLAWGETGGVRGTTVDPGAVLNTKGSWTEIIASTFKDIGGLMIVIGDDNSGTKSGTTRCLVDLAIGASGSELIILADLANMAGTGVDQRRPRLLGPVPIDIPAGTRIAARAQSSQVSTGSRELDMIVYGLVA